MKNANFSSIERRIEKPQALTTEEVSILHEFNPSLGLKVSDNWRPMAVKVGAFTSRTTMKQQLNAEQL